MSKLNLINAIPSAPAAAPKATGATGTVQDGILTLMIPLKDLGLSSTGSSRLLARFAGTRIEGPVSFLDESGEVISHPDLRMSLYGGASLHSKNPALRMALGLSEKGGK
jgi:hypothetical protein